MKQIKIMLGLLIVAATVSMSACTDGKGEIVTKKYDLTGFKRISHGTKGEVVVVADANQYVEVHAQENIIGMLRIKVVGDRLDIGQKNMQIIGKVGELKFYVHTPALTGFEVSGSGNITGHGVTAGEFTAKVSGSGTLDLSGIDGSSVKTDVSGSGKVTLRGTAGQSQFNISGSGRIHAFDLVSARTDADISGSGSVETTTTTTLNADISGSGTVRYKGQPQVTVSSSGSGTVVNAN